MFKRSFRWAALITAVTFAACETTALDSVEQHDDLEQQCATLKRQIRIAQRDETANRNYATAFQIRANAALERLEKHKPYLEVTKAAVDFWQKKVDESGGETAWAHASSAILFVVEGLCLVKLGSALRTTGKACTTLGVKGAARAAYQFTKREVTDAFGKGTLSGTKKVLGLAIRKGAPAGFLTGINAERYFRFDGDWTMAVPIYGTYQEHELKIAMINSYGDALNAAKEARTETQTIVDALQKDVDENETKVKDFLKKADDAKKRKEDLQKQLDALLMQKQQCSVSPLATLFEAVTASVTDTTTTDATTTDMTTTDTTTIDTTTIDTTTTDEPECLECVCGTWDDGDTDLPDGEDFEWLDEVDYGTEPDRVIENLNEPYIVTYIDESGTTEGGTVP